MSDSQTCLILPASLALVETVIKNQHDGYVSCFPERSKRQKRKEPLGDGYPGSCNDYKFVVRR